MENRKTNKGPRRLSQHASWQDIDLSERRMDASGFHISHAFFHLLWLSGPNPLQSRLRLRNLRGSASFSTSQQTARDPLVLPDTLLYQQADTAADDLVDRLLNKQAATTEAGGEKQAKDKQALFPGVWYFTSYQDGTIKRKTRSKTTDLDNVLAAFGSTLEQDRHTDLRAKWVVTFIDNQDPEDSYGECKTFARYLNTSGLTNVLSRTDLNWSRKISARERLSGLSVADPSAVIPGDVSASSASLSRPVSGRKRPDAGRRSGIAGYKGFLQKFVHPVGEHNEVYCATWSSKGGGACKVDKCVNSRSLLAPLPADRRATTFSFSDPACDTAVRVSVKGSVFPQRIQAACDDIAQHILCASEGNLQVANMRLYFKLASNNMLHILHADFLQFSHEVLQVPRGDISLNLVEGGAGDDRVGMTASSDVQVWKLDHKDEEVSGEESDDIDSEPTKEEIDVDALKRTKSEEFTCPKCRLSALLPEVFATPVSLLIANHSLLERFEQAYPALQQVRVMAEHTVKKQARATAPEVEVDENRGEGVEELGDELKIPPTLRQVYPSMTYDEYCARRLDPDFVNSSIELCQDCFSTVLPIARNRRNLRLGLNSAGFSNTFEETLDTGRSFNSDDEHGAQNFGLSRLTDAASLTRLHSQLSSQQPIVGRSLGHRRPLQDEESDKFRVKSLRRKEKQAPRREKWRSTFASDRSLQPPRPFLDIEEEKAQVEHLLQAKYGAVHAHAGPSASAIRGSVDQNSIHASLVDGGGRAAHSQKNNTEAVVSMMSQQPKIIAQSVSLHSLRPYQHSVRAIRLPRKHPAVGRVQSRPSLFTDPVELKRWKKPAEAKQVNGLHPKLGNRVRARDLKHFLHEGSMH